MAHQYSRKEELRIHLKDEYCDLERIENHFGQDCGPALQYITEAKKNIALALKDLKGEIPDCKTWISPLATKS